MLKHRLPLAIRPQHAQQFTHPDEGVTAVLRRNFPDQVDAQFIWIQHTAHPCSKYAE